MPSLTIRYDDETHRKMKVIAAYQGISLNTLIMRSFENVIAAWEAEHGTLVLPDQEQK
ncbi:MAG: toxin-antitoxin system HicB family antitoxin [Synergistaceae bacterium]|nr:toxin-antitoxin system HicB family antitoxin [Synergistaceae bacterium]